MKILRGTVTGFVLLLITSIGMAQELSGAGDPVTGAVLKKNVFNRVGSAERHYYTSNALTTSLSWLTYLGGSSSDEMFGIASTPDSGAVVVGRTSSLNFPSTTGSWQDSLNANYDAVITRFDRNGNCLWSTYYGGNDFDGAWSVIRVDSLYFVCGNTNSTTLPMVNATQNSNAGSYDGFVAVFNDSGILVRSTYFGGSGGDQFFALALDTAGRIVVAGSSSSSNLPFTSGQYQSACAGAIDACIVVFDQQLNPQWATYYGGTNTEDIHSITTTAQGEIVIAGGTYSGNFPVTANAFQNGMLSMPDCYLVKFGMDGTRHYATFFGGSNSEDCNAVESDSAGRIYVTGFTYSMDFPIMGNSFQTLHAAQSDVFISMFDLTGQMTWSTFAGDNGAESGIALHRKGKYLFVCGNTESAAFPVSANAIQPVYAGNSDGFVIKIDTAGNMVSGTFMGGNGTDALYGVTVTNDTSAISCGTTYSTDLSVTAGAYQSVNMTQGDGYVLKFPMSEQPVGNAMTNEGSGPCRSFIFPNPAHDKIHFTEAYSAVSIYSIEGKCIRSDVNDGNSVMIDDLEQGTYLMIIRMNDGECRSFLFQKM